MFNQRGYVLTRIFPSRAKYDLALTSYNKVTSFIISAILDTFTLKSYLVGVIKCLNINFGNTLFDDNLNWRPVQKLLSLDLHWVSRKSSNTRYVLPIFSFEIRESIISANSHIMFCGFRIAYTQKREVALHARKLRARSIHTCS